MADVSGRAVQARDVRGGVHFHGHGASHSSTPVPRQLPGDVRGFVNRTGEPEILSARVHDTGQSSEERSETAVHVIAGTAGVGKTALALRWAHRVRERFPDGQLYVDLQGYGPDLPMASGQVLERFLRAFGVPADAIPSDTDSRAALYRSFLAERRVLILLDNASTTAQVRPLLPGSADCAVVITSRDRLSGLVARDGAQRLTVRTLGPAEAVELLEYVTVRHRPQDDPQEVAELARLCGRLPLALRIAAERAVSRPHMPLDDLIQDLRDESALWDALATDDEEEADTVRSVFAWSYRALPQEAARLFRLLGLHPGRDFATGAAAALADLSERRARRTLDSLVDVHLLEQTGPDRYLFHDLLRSYAMDQVRDEEPLLRGHAPERLLLWYLRSAYRAGQALDSNLRRPEPDDLLTGSAQDRPSVFTDNTEAIRWFEVEGPNLMSAAEAAASHGLDGLTWRFPYVLRHFPTCHTFGQKWNTVLRLGLEAVRREHRPLTESDLEESLGIAHLQSNRPDDAIIHHGLALELRREAGDELGVAMSLNAVGLVHLRGHRLGEARDRFERSLASARVLEDRLWEGTALGNLVRCLLDAGHVEEAVGLADQALTLHRRTGNRMSEFACLTSLSAAWRELGRADRSLALTEQALEIAQELDHTVREGSRSSNSAGSTCCSGTWRTPCPPSTRRRACTAASPTTCARPRPSRAWARSTRCSNALTRP
ncbi:tetratricopeptide (TPR) repeat protein [Nocardiopsis arvandica]|uniref:Tetratricopeptide (TPR) repeat protein n=1 Tax=Nocardiopsis sinuspersici TaxID=501010 RepID=A0A7Y9XH64_9ACTN|nr:tetratricopeptide (TPR) repeat protein [Nocardiopsis sinuspersici]